MAPLPFGCYGLREHAAFERPVGAIVPAEGKHAVVTLHDGLIRRANAGKSVFWPIAPFRKVSQSNRLILG